MLLFALKTHTCRRIMECGKEMVHIKFSNWCSEALIEDCIYRKQGFKDKTMLKKKQTKQNHAIRLMCFACIFGNVTESVLLLLNLLDVLTVNNLYRLHTLKFTHLWYKGLLPDLFQNMQIVFMGIKHQICIQTKQYKPKRVN